MAMADWLDSIADFGNIYVVQFHVITDRFNALFPLNWLIVFGLVCVTAYLLRVIVNVFLQFMGKDPWLWRQCLLI